MPRNWHVINAANVPEVIWTRSQKTNRVFFYKSKLPQVPIAYADKVAGSSYRLCRSDGTAISGVFPNILACQLAIRDRL